MIVINEKLARHIEKTGEQVLSKDPRKWAEYTRETLEDQQELYLETLSEFNDVPLEKMPQDAHDMLFDVCVYLAIFRTLLQHKRIGWSQLHLIPAEPTD